MGKRVEVLEGDEMLGIRRTGRDTYSIEERTHFIDPTKDDRFWPSLIGRYTTTIAPVDDSHEAPEPAASWFGRGRAVRKAEKGTRTKLDHGADTSSDKPGLFVSIGEVRFHHSLTRKKNKVEQTRAILSLRDGEVPSENEDDGRSITVGHRGREKKLKAWRAATLDAVRASLKTDGGKVVLRRR